MTVAHGLVASKPAAPVGSPPRHRARRQQTDLNGLDAHHCFWGLTALTLPLTAGTRRAR